MRFSSRRHRNPRKGCVAVATPSPPGPTKRLPCSDPERQPRPIPASLLRPGPRARTRGSGRAPASRCSTSRPSSPVRWCGRSRAPPPAPCGAGRTTSSPTSRRRCPSSSSRPRRRPRRQSGAGDRAPGGDRHDGAASPPGVPHGRGSPRLSRRPGPMQRPGTTALTGQRVPGSPLAVNACSKSGIAVRCGARGDDAGAGLMPPFLHACEASVKSGAARRLRGHRGIRGDRSDVDRHGASPLKGPPLVHPRAGELCRKIEPLECAGVANGY